MTLDDCLREWEEFEIAGPRPHPCVFFSEEEIDWTREQSEVAGTRQHQERGRIVEAAECLVDQDLAIVRKGWLGGTRWGMRKVRHERR